MNFIRLPYDCLKSIFSETEKPLENYTTKDIFFGASLYTGVLFSVGYIFLRKKRVIHDDEYKTILFPENNQNFQVGEVVFVLKDKKPFAKAKIIKDIETEKTNKFFGRFEVEFLGDKTLYHCRPQALIRIEDSKKTKKILVCETTHEYRRMAKTQIDKNDLVLEIGSDFGETTKFLHEICKKVIGIDKSKVHVERAKKMHPEIQFECLDVFLKIEKFKEIGKGCNKIFIDINGNREYQSVIDLIILVKDLFKPEMIFVKSKKLKDLYKNDESMMLKK
eukprot:gene6546-10552_t